MKKELVMVSALLSLAVMTLIATRAVAQDIPSAQPVNPVLPSTLSVPSASGALPVRGLFGTNDCDTTYSICLALGRDPQDCEAEYETCLANQQTSQ